MNAQHNLNPKGHFDWQSEKFEEPRTMPAGWDLSGLQTGQNKGLQSSDKAHSAQDEAKVHPSKPAEHSEKFEEPRTTPKYWDVSSLK
jgi:hypothetical protein